MDAAQPAPPEEPQSDGNALETPENDENALEGSTTSDVTDATTAGSKAGPDPFKPHGLKDRLRRLNIYLLLFIFVLVIAGLIIAIAYFQSKSASTSSTLKTQTLTQNTLDQVASSDATVGDSQQVLNVQSSAVFAGKVLIREDLEVAGNLQVGGTAALTDLAVSGASALSQVSVSKDLAVTGNAAIQGAVTIAKSLQVNAGGTFSGPLSAPQITTTNFQLNGDLILTHHITAGGASPGRSNGPALGAGGTATVGGSDTAGSVTINTGSGPIAGCFLTVTFDKSFNSTPRVLVTPVGVNTGTLDYYVNRTTTGFSICDATAPPAGSSFAFDYFILD